MVPLWIQDHPHSIFYGLYMNIITLWPFPVTHTSVPVCISTSCFGSPLFWNQNSPRCLETTADMLPRATLWEATRGNVSVITSCSLRAADPSQTCSAASCLKNALRCHRSKHCPLSVVWRSLHSHYRIFVCLAWSSLFVYVCEWHYCQLPTHSCCLVWLTTHICTCTQTHTAHK